ncbi:MAG: RidA family protein [Thaumarchaeota archaeon]|nr:RidA family protein [Nitrososphaerota archaeon]
MRRPKRGLGLITHGGKLMRWGKGAVAGDFIFLSGAEARADDSDFPPVGIRAQTELALNRVEKRLKEAGASMDSVVRFVWYLTNRTDLDAFYEARDDWLDKHAPTLLRERSYASTLLIVGLARPDMLVEIDCTAYVTDGDKSTT